MKIACLQEQIKKGLAIVNRAVPSRTPLPMTKNVLMTAKDDRLRLSATNLEISITTWAEAKIETEGEIAIPATLMNELVNSFSNEVTNMEVLEGTNTMRVECGHGLANVNGSDPADFPPVPSIGNGTAATIESRVLKAAITKVAFAAANEDSRPILQGVETTISEDRLIMAACDGFRLAVFDGALLAPAPDETQMIIPAKNLSELVRLLPDDETTVDITLGQDNRQALFRINTANAIEFTSLLIQGAFPKYDHLVPTEHQTTTVLATADLQQAIRTTAIFAKDNNIICLEIDAEAGKITTSAKSAETGNSRNEIFSRSLEGDNLKISFNSIYLQTAIAALHSLDTTLRTKGPMDPGLFTPVQDRPAQPSQNGEVDSEVLAASYDKYFHVIMPMSIEN